MKFCDEIDEKISLFIDDKLNSEQADEFKKHISECHSCREQFEDICFSVELCKSIPEQDPPTLLDDLIMDRIKSEITTKKSKVYLYPGKYFKYISAGLAACLLIAVILTGKAFLPGNMKKDATSSIAMSAAGSADTARKEEAYEGLLDKRSNQEASDNVSTFRQETAAKAAADRIPPDAMVVSMVITTDNPKGELEQLENLVLENNGMKAPEGNTYNSSYIIDSRDIILNIELPSKNFDTFKVSLSNKYGSNLLIREGTEDKQASLLKISIILRSK